MIFKTGLRPKHIISLQFIQIHQNQLYIKFSFDCLTLTQSLGPCNKVKKDKISVFELP